MSVGLDVTSGAGIFTLFPPQHKAIITPKPRYLTNSNGIETAPIEDCHQPPARQDLLKMSVETLAAVSDALYPQILNPLQAEAPWKCYSSEINRTADLRP
jgi:hypothetical protein